MITVDIEGVRIDVAPGATLQDICDANDTAVVFGCRAASCGACMIRVRHGAENLSAAADDERAVLGVLATSDDCRLACQITVHGAVSIEIAD